MLGSSQSSESANIDPEINIDFKEILHLKKALFQKCTRDWTNLSSKNLEN